MVLDLNYGWHFKSKSNPSGKTVDLPHDAMLEEKREQNGDNGVQTGFFPGGFYTYEKDLCFTKDDLSKSLIVHFDGVYRHSSVYLNGDLLKTHANGYTSFDVDITSKAKLEINLLKVEVDNSLCSNSRWYSGSGIYRKVTLLKRNLNHFSDIVVSTKSINPPTIEIKWTIPKEKETTISIFDKKEQIYSGKEKTIRLPKAQLWSEANPYTYTLRLANEDDETEVAFGIRIINCDSKEGLRINGQRILLKGACIHSDNGILGACEYQDAAFRRIKTLKEEGFNAIRSSHNPCSEEILQACDQLGMYILDEAFDGWYIPKEYHDYSRDFAANYSEDLKAMVNKDINHPSVIMYSLGNEVSETAEEKGVKLAGEMHDIVKKADDSRPITCAVNPLINVYSKMGVGIYKENGPYDKNRHSGKQGYREKKTGSAFFNFQVQKLGKLFFLVSKGKRGDEAVKDIAEKVDILGLNYGSSRYAQDAKKYPSRVMLGTETMVQDLPFNWDKIKNIPAVIGDFVWAGWDYLGEAGIGDWIYYSYPGLPILAGSGVIDINGVPGAEMKYMRQVWELDDNPFLGVRPLNHRKERPQKSAWRFTDCIASYNWQGFEGKKAVAEVYSHFPIVCLYQNGKLLKKAKTKNYKSIFKFICKPGELKAVCLDEKGQQKGQTALASGSKETKLILAPDRLSLPTDGKSLLFVSICFADTQGQIKPAVEERVSLSFEGPLKLLGFGSSRCKQDESYQTLTATAYCGRLLAVFGSTHKEGIGVIKADSALGSSEIKINVVRKEG